MLHGHDMAHIVDMTRHIDSKFAPVLDFYIYDSTPLNLPFMVSVCVCAGGWVSGWVGGWVGVNVCMCENV